MVGAGEWQALEKSRVRESRCWRNVGPRNVGAAISRGGSKGGLEKPAPYSLRFSSSGH